MSTYGDDCRLVVVYLHEKLLVRPNCAMTDSCRSTAYHTIREAILEGKLHEGDRVSEYALARQLGLSRAPIREAINQLVSQGLLEQIAGSGTFVRQLDFHELEEVYELREWLECGALTSSRFLLTDPDLAAIRATCDDVRKLIKETHQLNADDQAETAAFVKRLYLADARFHLLILRGAQNILALQTMQDRLILEQIWSSNRISLEVSSLENLLKEHTAIYAQLEQRDYAAGAELLRTHIRSAIDRYREVHQREQQAEQLGRYFS
ncbi:MAG: hypothetical protein CMJ46_12785 [Planctomyces sp.]|nr:hypothetical protein [Planctomyces sp.]